MGKAIVSAIDGAICYELSIIAVANTLNTAGQTESVMTVCTTACLRYSDCPASAYSDAGSAGDILTVSMSTGVLNFA